MPTITQDKPMTTAATILQEEDRYRTLWQRTYAPLRRAISGTWVKRDETARFKLRLDGDGGFELTCYDTSLFLKWRYTVMMVDGAHWIAFDCCDGQKHAARIEDADMWRLKLSWLDDPSNPFELVRQGESRRAAIVA
jgi:hypothetical protein